MENFKTIIGKSDRISNISVEFLINDRIVSDKTFITNAFNNYFLNVGKTLYKIIVPTGDPLSYVNSILPLYLCLVFNRLKYLM